MHRYGLIFWGCICSVANFNKRGMQLASKLAKASAIFPSLYLKNCYISK